RSKASIQKSVDSVAASYLKDKKAAGMSIAVLRGADTLVMKGYGYADLELDVPTPPRAVYEIGSVTKQFTAASILMLRDQGKLDLDDEITKYLPTYPTQGHKITVRRLLDHTSGIKGYTELPKFGTIMTRHLPKDSLVALFSGEKFDFPTGDRMIYNNSAYFLAGMIIEKVSGMSYGDFVKKNLFDKAGMADSRYCSETAIIKRKAHGYDMGPNGLQNKGFVDHTYPFSAGSLCSTVGDLASWNRALHKGKILSAKSYTDITTPGVLNDGTKLRYTKGLAIHENHGHHVIEHGGGINGFLSASDYFDQDDLVVIVLVNSAGPVAPDAIVGDIADVILGKKALATQNFTGSLADLTGKFAGVSRGPQLVLTVTADKGKLVATTPMAPKPLNLQYIGNDTWDSDGQHVTFVREGGKVTKLRIDQVYGYYILDRQP
ncbi:MAG: serine hydrolase domain-containing protein, partial [Gemmatimonadaceae bacterium]